MKGKTLVAAAVLAALSVSKVQAECTYGGVANECFGLGAMNQASAEAEYNTALGYVSVGGASFPNNGVYFSGDSNTGVGHWSLGRLSSGNANTAVGAYAADNMTSGSGNTAVGFDALSTNFTGSYNVALGESAGWRSEGSYNIYIGWGQGGAANDNRVIRIGNQLQNRTHIAGIRNVKTKKNDAVMVVIDSAGQLGTVNSSARYKNSIMDMGEYSEAILQLRPVTYRYNGDVEVEPGLIAEEVQEVMPSIVVENEDGSVQTIQYHKLVPLLLNELQKLEARVAELEGR